jgi:hypothetical protein
MLRSALSLTAGLVTWVLAASVLNRLLRAGFDGYALAEPSLAFTFAMQCARLLVGGLSSLATGWVVGRVQPARPQLAWIAGGIIFVMFVPVHYGLWDRFPVWYHLTFLLSIVPLVVTGRGLTRASH